MLESDYNKLPGVRWSRLRAMLKSALQYFFESQEGAEKEDTKALRVGRGIHCFVLEPDLFGDHFTVYREDKSKGAGSRTRWQEFKAECDARGVTILDGDEYDAVVGAATALLGHPIAGRYLQGGVKEHLVQWTDKETGLACKARLDQANHHLVDIKSTTDVTPRVFATQAARLAYHAQVAFYLDGARAAKMKLDPEPIILAVESAPPHDVVPYRVNTETLEIGRRLYRSLLARLVECQMHGRWPGLAPDDVIELELPLWALPEDEERELILPGGERMSI